MNIPSSKTRKRRERRRTPDQIFADINRVADVRQQVWSGKTKDGATGSILRCNGKDNRLRNDDGTLARLEAPVRDIEKVLDRLDRERRGQGLNDNERVANALEVINPRGGSATDDVL